MKTKNEFLSISGVALVAAGLMSPLVAFAAASPASPFISPPIALAVTSTGPAPGDQTAPAVGFNGSRFLMVWETRDADGNVTGIRGSLVSSNAAAPDPHPLEISSSGFAPAVAGGPGGEFLVVWADGRNAGTSGTDIYGAIVKPDGGLMFPGGIPVCTAAGDQLAPTVAATSKDFVVAWQDARHFAETGFDLYGTHVSDQGTVLDGNGMPISTEPGGQFSPAVAVNGDRAFIAWVDTRKADESTEIYGAETDLTDIAFPPPDILISTGPALKLHPAVAGNGTNFLTVWEDHRHPPEKGVTIYGARVIAGEVADPDGFPISVGLENKFTPAVAVEGPNYVVAWVDARNQAQSGLDIYGARVSTDAQVLDAAGFPICIAPGDQRRPAAVSDSYQGPIPWCWQLVWQDLRDEATSGSDIYGAFMMDGLVTDLTVGGLMSVGPTAQQQPAIAFNGSQYLSVWRGVSSNGSGTMLYFFLSGSDGTPLWPEPIGLSTGPNPSSPVVAANGRNFLIAWVDTRNAATSGLDIYAAVLSGATGWEKPVVIPICTAKGDQLAPVLGGYVDSDSNWFIAWQDGRNFAHSGFDIYGARVNHQGFGRDGDGIPISSAPNDQFSPAMAMNGSTAMLVWVDAQQGGESTEISGAEMDLASLLPNVPKSPSPISAGTGLKLNPAVAGNGSEFLVVWEQHKADSSGVDIVGSLVTAQSSIAVWVNHGSQKLKPSVGRFGSDFFIAWEDFRDFASNGFDIYGTRLSRTGGVWDPEGIPISTSPGDQHAPQVLTGEGCEVFVASQTSVEGVNRLTLNRISFELAPLALACWMNRTVECGTPWDFDPPAPFTNCVGTNFSIAVLETKTNALCRKTFSATRTWRASDASGNFASCSQTITVVDTTAPVIACPSDVTVEATSSSGAVARFAVSASDDCDNNPTVSCTPMSGTVFPLGTNRVECIATDACGNRASCVWAVIAVMMRDSVPPEIFCPTNMIVACNSSNGASVSFTVSATDVEDPNPVVVCQPGPGRVFPFGTTFVRCTATDRSENRSDCVFTVTVEDDPQPQLTIERSPDGAPTAVICWAATCRTYVLQCTPSLEIPIVWMPVAAPVLTEGNRFCVRVPTQSGSRFYRLCPTRSLLPEDPVQQRARAAISAQEEELGLSPGDSFEPRGPAFEDELDQWHARFDRFHQGMPVIGGDFVVHLSPTLDGLAFAGFSATVTKPLPMFPQPDPLTEPAEILQKIFEGLEGDYASLPSARLVVYAADENGAPPELAYDVTLVGSRTGAPSHLHSLVSVQRPLRVLNRFDTVWTDGPDDLRRGCARNAGHSYFSGPVTLDTMGVYRSDASSPSSYELRDCHRAIEIHYAENDTRRTIPGAFHTEPTIPGPLARDADGDWGSGILGTNPGQLADYQTAAVDAHYALTQAYDYFLREHHRCGLDGVCPDFLYRTPFSIVASVQYGRQDYLDEAGTAFWRSGEGLLAFGAGGMLRWGQRMQTRQWVSPDIVGHEYTHAITFFTANLNYEGQSGALNESMSDVFGKMIEFAIRGEEAAGWWIGERIWTVGTAGDALRYLDTPRRDGDSIDHMDQYVASLDVHYSSGLPNNVFYLVAHGGTNPTSHMSVTGIGASDAARIWYRALTVYMTSGTTFREAADHTLTSARDLFGASSPQSQAVLDGWRAVGVLR